MNEPQIVKIALGRLKPSSTNPRKHFDQAKLEELIESVRRSGIIQPLLARPDWCIGKNTEEIAALNGNTPEAIFFDIVAGERRFRAASELALPDAPVIVQWLGDKEALELQLIENLQREDLSAIEEAEAYRRLMNLGYTVELIHERTGKTRRTIYGKLKLLAAPKSLRNAVEAGTIGARVAEIIGRIPVAEMREAAAKEVLHPPYQSDPLNSREAQQLVNEHYMRSLSGAPFDQKDETLLPVMTDEATGERIGGGACADCPMKTGNSPELFGDVKRPDVCTNTRCFGLKLDRLSARLEEAAKAEGKRFLSEAEGKQIFEYDGDLYFDSPYVKLTEQPDRAEVAPAAAAEKLPSWKKLLGPLEAKPQIILARDPKGRVVELVERKLAIEAVNLAAKEKGETSIFAGARASGGTSGNSALASDQKRMRTIAKQRLAVSLAAMEQLVGAIESKGEVEGCWDALIKVSLGHASHDGCWLICKRLALDPKSKNHHTTLEGVQGAVLEYGLSLPAESKLAFVVELLISQATKFASASYGGGLKSIESFTTFAKLYAIDIDAVEKRVKAEVKESSQAKKKKKPEKGQSDVKAPAKGTVEHQWDRKALSLYGDGAPKFICKRCGATGEQVGMSWPPVLDDEFLEKPCLPNQKKTRRKPTAETRAKISAGRKLGAKIKAGRPQGLSDKARKTLSAMMKRRWAARRRDEAKKGGTK